jgi:hypothetical protein
MTGETFADVTELKVSDDCKGTTGWWEAASKAVV